MLTRKRGCGLAVFTACVLSIVAVQLVLMPLPVQAQAVNATVLGTVNDSTGALVGGATVVIKELGTGLSRTTTTNSSGNYTFPDMPPGTYSVTAELSGFKKEVRPSIDVVVNSSVRVDLTLQPGAVTETVEVTAAAPILQTDRADVGSKIEEQQMQQLPIGGANRNFQSLLALVPGTTKPHRDHSEFFNAQDTLSVEVNGQSREFNQLSIEGVNDDERTGLLQIYVPPAEAIQTVDVTTSNYAAEFGRAGGAVTNVILKSGTNNFHGSLYEYNRVSALATRTYFQRNIPGAPPFPRSTYNYYGGTIGGPIIKDKTFFFFDLLRIDDIRGQFNQFTLPTDAFRNGDLTGGQSNIFNPFTGAANGTGRTQFMAQSALGKATVQGPNGPVDAFNAACTNAAGCPNMIPTALFDPISLKILALVPHVAGTCSTPGCFTNDFSENTLFTKNNTSFDFKLDHNLTQKDRLAFRFSRAVQNPLQQPAFGLAGGPVNGGFQGASSQHEQSGALNWTRVFSPTLVMETRGGISHYRNIALTSDHGSTASTALGIPGVNLDAFTSGLTQIEIQSGFANPFVGYANSQPWDRGETNIDIVNNWTKIHGNHTFKWGADVRRLRDDLVQAQNFGPRGHFFFGTGTTLNGGGSGNLANTFAAFLLDAPTEVGRDISVVSGSWRETEAFFYGQDSWHITPKFTLDAGLRWELYEPATASHPGRYSNYDPTQNLLVIAGIDGNPANLGRETYYKYFAPRIGVAYRLSEQTVFRGGFGISYEPFTNNGYAFNFPIRQNQDFVGQNGFVQAQYDLTQPACLTTQRVGCASMTTGFPAPGAVPISSNGTVAPHSGESYTVIDKHFQEPYIESYNVAIQRALPWQFVLDVAYVGNHGVKIPVAYNLNAALAPSLCTAAQIAGGLAGCTSANNVGDVQGKNCVAGNSTRPLCNQFGRSGDTSFLFKPTVSNYNSLQVKFDRRFKNGFSLTTAYTYGKELGFRSKADEDDGKPDNFLDFQRNYSVMSLNRLHTFVQSYVYELPFGKNKQFLTSGPASWILGGWGVSGVLTRMSGTPLRFTASGGSLAANGTTQVPIQIAPFHVLGGIGQGNPWFDPTAFCNVVGPGSKTAPGCSVSPNGVLGNMNRYMYTGPGLFNLDAAVYRTFPVKEHMGLEFRAEAFSITNTPHFSNPDTTVTDGNFGAITGTGTTNGKSVGDGNRVIELSARFTF